MMGPRDYNALWKREEVIGGKKFAANLPLGWLSGFNGQIRADCHTCGLSLTRNNGSS